MGDKCPGVSSSEAGRAEGCKGCPSVSYCSQPRQKDPDIEPIRENLAGIGAIVAVMSGKGGVGKSTVTRAIAEHISSRRVATCILDLDLSGPSIPRLTGTDGTSMCEANGMLQPVEIGRFLKAVSVGHLQESCGEGAMFSSRLKTGAVKKLLKSCNYDGVEVLLVDTPPNVSDEHLAMVNFMRPSFGVVVTTPQKFSLQDVARQIDFCRKAGIGVLGVVENMKRFVCPGCGHHKSIFKDTGVESYCISSGIPYLGSIDLRQEIARRSDSGDAVQEEVLGQVADAILSVLASKGRPPGPEQQAQ